MVHQGASMSRVAQPSERLLAVVAELLVEHGYEGLSIRRVASAAGVSIGAVQHHFPTKGALLAAAMASASAEFEARLHARLPPGTPPDQALRAVADELLGAGEERRPVSVIWIARLARAAVHEPTAEAHRREWQQVEDLLHALLRAARPDLTDAEARAEAGLLLALLDGLAGALAVEPGRVSEDRGRALLTRHLEALLDPG